MAGGRPKGSVDPTTQRIREAMKRIVVNNLDKFDGWLEEIAAKDKTQAAKLIVEMAEFSIPKIARTELSGPDGKDLDYTVNVRGINAANPKDG